MALSNASAHAKLPVSFMMKPTAMGVTMMYHAGRWTSGSYSHCSRF